MRGRHHAGRAVRDQQRDAVCRLDGERDRWIVGDDDIGVGPRLERPAAAGPPDDDRGAVDLVQSNKVSRVDAERGRDWLPVLVRTARGGPQRPIARRKQVIGERAEGHADERRAARRLHPLETIVRL